MTAYENDLLHAHRIMCHAVAHRSVSAAWLSGLLFERRALLWIDKR